MAEIKPTNHRPRAGQQAAWVFLRYMLNAGDADQWVNRIGNEYSVQSWLFGRFVTTNPPKIMIDECRSVYRKLQHKFETRPFYSEILRYVGDRFGLNEAERRIIWLAVLVYECNGFRGLIGHVECEMSHCSEAARVIARMIGIDFVDVLPAIGLSGHLGEIGLLKPAHNYSDLTDYLKIPHRLFVALAETVSPVKAMDAFLQPARPGTLCAEDFPHLQNDLTHVCRYLQSVLHNQTRGVNVLFYGMPGTGKTEFAGLIARHLEVPLYVVSEDQSEPNDDDKQSRLAAYRMTQALLSPTKSLILFDDVEDGILDWDREIWRARTSGKASLNALLESNPVPAIWITNVAWRFDEAHLRRFDLAVGFKPPPRSVRVSMIDKHLHRLPLTSSFKSTLADDRDLTPAQIGKIARVVDCVATHDTHARDLEPMAVHLYRAAYKLRFGREPYPCGNAGKSVEFDTDCVNSSVPAARIVEMFLDATKLTACFHGLPGTGKTALAAHIARILDKPVLVKRASDLLRPYVGETEMMLRGMFDEAMDENAVLLLDEADSFLTNRTRARRTWEITQVNELLTQIERFRGRFIATTNAFDVLDLASLRRFDLKIRFEPLRPDQRLRMFEAVIERLGVEPKADPLQSSPDIATTLNGMPQLTPGDFAVVARRMSFGGSRIDAQTVLDALSEEHRYKQHLGRSIGFLR